MQIENFFSPSIRGAGLVLVSAVLAFGSGPAAAGSRPLEPRDLVEMERLADPRISPDGLRVAFLVHRHSREEGPSSALYLVGAEGGEPRRLAPEQRGPRSPRWAPDGGTLYFLGELDGTQRVLGAEPSSGTFRAVAGDVTAGARALEPAPDGKQLAFLRRDPLPAQEAARREAGDDAEVVGSPPQHVRLWVLDLETGAARAVSRPDRSVWHFGWSPDSRRIAVLASESPIAEGHEYGSALSILDLDTGAERQLSPRASAHAEPAFSHDGRWIGFLAPVGDFVERGTVHVVGAGGESPPRPLLEDLGGNVWDLAWHPRKHALLAAVGRGTLHELAEVELDGRVTPLFTHRHSLMPYWTPMWSVSADGRTFAYLSEAKGPPPEGWPAEGWPAEGWPAEVWLAGAGMAPRPLTRFNRRLDGVELGKVETYRWQNSADGSDGRGIAVEGILVSPPGAGAEALPLVVVLHGGPAYHWGLGGQLASWAQLWAARGNRVLLPNFRGSSGYGLEWMRKNVRDWGDGPMGDVMSGVDALIADGRADPRRLFLAGGSYGGYLGFWMLGHTDRFRAAFTRAGIADLASEYALTDEPSFLVGYFQATPYQDPEVYRRSSPLTYAGRVTTPLLMIHGERDLRVPPSESRRFYDALRHHGSEAVLVIYPREGHGISEYRHQIDSMERALDWFARWDPGQGPQQ